MATNESLPAQVEEIQLTKEYALKSLTNLFSSLEDATGDTLTTLQVINSITDGINADPQFSKQILTPDNIARAFALKAKSDAGTIKLDDIEEAFPVIAEKFGPFWGIVKTFKF